jgi:hypothetical protein
MKKKLGSGWTYEHQCVTFNVLDAVPPRWILEPTDKAFAQGSNAKVECKADGFPKPQVTWKKAAGEIYLIKIFS